MKRLWNLMILSLLSLPFTRADEAIHLWMDQIEYRILEDRSAEVVQVETDRKAILFPDSIRLEDTRYPVRAIALHALDKCPSADSIVLPRPIRILHRATFEKTRFFRRTGNRDADGVLRIGDVLIACKSSKIKKTYTTPIGIRIIATGALGTCEKLEDLNVSEGVEFLPENGFKGCGNLREVTLPNSLRAIAPKALNGTAVLKNKSRKENGIRYVGNYAMDCDRKLSADIIVREGTLLMADGLFENHNELRHVVLPSSLRAISDNAFANCLYLESVTMGDSICVIGRTAFINCERLDSIRWSTGLTTIREGAFHYCTSVGSLTLPNRLVSIGDAAFYHCLQIESVTLPNSLQHLGESAFNGCIHLKEIRVPSLVTSIGMGCFFHCESLQEADLGACKELEEIPRYCFKRCTELHTVVLPRQDLEIMAEAFEEDDHLKDYRYSNSE